MQSPWEMSRKQSKPNVKLRQVPEPSEADRLNDAVYRILEKLKAGRAVRLPGLGILRPGPEKSVLFDGLAGAGPNGRGNANKKQRPR